LEYHGENTTPVINSKWLKQWKKAVGWSCTVEATVPLALGTWKCRAVCVVNCIERQQSKQTIWKEVWKAVNGWHQAMNNWRR